MTTWILHALADNGADTKLFTFDIMDKWKRQDEVAGKSASSPAGTAERAENRWQLIIGDARETMAQYEPIDYIHSDAEHSVDFAKWLAHHMSVGQQQCVPFSFHDVWKPYT